MPDRTPTIYIIAGCNGAGKTTFAREYLPHEVKCLRFLNADELARGLSPLDPAAGAFKAGRLLLKEVHESISKREAFALESTLSGRTYVNVFHKRDVLVTRSNCTTSGSRRRRRQSLAFASACAVAATMFRARCSTPIPPELEAFVGGLPSSRCAMDHLG